MDPAAFDETRAFEEVEALVSLGPHPSGSEAAEQAALHLRDRFAAAGCRDVRVDAFDDPTPRGSVRFRNVMAGVPGRGPAQLLIGSHYDTKSGIGDGFVGANDSGSSTGVLIELARLAAAAAAAREPPPPLGLLFVAFDGEEAMERYGPTDGFHGSRYLAESLRREDRLRHLRAVIILDMIGDRDLTVTVPRNSSPELVSLAFRAARAQGTRGYFRLYERQIMDDHTAFLRAGVPAIDLIDFQFGSGPGRNDYWHTGEDTLEHISAESLGIVARVTVEMINRLMAEETARAP